MRDETSKDHPQDVTSINVNAREEVRWWCDKLGCNERRLKNAVLAVGPSTEAVRKYITKEGF